MPSNKIAQTLGPMVAWVLVLLGAIVSGTLGTSLLVIIIFNLILGRKG